MTEEMESTKRVKKQPSGDYEVGYCRPPKASRWGPGQSGNPRGPRTRPNKRHQDMIRLLREELISEISAVEGGTEIRIDLMRFIAKQLVADFAKGTPPQRLRLFKELLNLGVLQPSSEDYERDPERISKFIEKLALESGLVRDAEGNYIEPGATRESLERPS